MTDIDPRFKEEVLKQPGGERLKRCFSCGVCTASCPVTEVDPTFNPRRIIRQAILGMRAPVLSSKEVWMCSACYLCYERCPQDVRITELMNALKNIAVQAGYMHPSFVAQVELLGEHGRLYELGSFENRKRDRAGLPRVIEKPEDVDKILSITGIRKKDKR